jgi:hypothetical protein
LAPFRELERRALFLADDLRRLEPLRALFRELFLADFRPPLLAAFLADFLALFRADFLPDFLADFLAALRRGRDVRRGAGSPKSSNDSDLEAGVGAGVLSIGSGSIQPEPDQPISI